ncbi:hypothetical protein JCM25156A_30060 [Komagataeibacter kakiaceti JCM 25156]
MTVTSVRTRPFTRNIDGSWYFPPQSHDGQIYGTRYRAMEPQGETAWHDFDVIALSLPADAG